MEKAHEQVQTYKKYWQMSGLPAAKYHPGAPVLFQIFALYVALSFFVRATTEYVTGVRRSGGCAARLVAMCLTSEPTVGLLPLRQAADGGPDADSFRRREKAGPGC